MRSASRTCRSSSRRTARPPRSRRSTVGATRSWVGRRRRSLFLLKDGSGEQELRRAYGPASWLQGREFDPEPAAIDVEKERARFGEVTGRSPDAWLAAWTRGEIPDTLENSFLYQRALLLGEA